ncbi:unnamed protein product [Allacma fusca]|uniref:Uncharacterized protein n=1 Tax=Allacma fusca TaxID=39272 RepID=A0A8J2JZY9_9HEXA|nr:unnamed protein product [Allacma fusca]
MHLHEPLKILRLPRSCDKVPLFKLNFKEYLDSLEGILYDLKMSQYDVMALSERPSGQQDASSSLVSNYGHARGLSVPDDSLRDSNFNKFRWRQREFLQINDCKKEIKSWSIRDCSMTLKFLELVGLNSMVNLKLILKYCANLSNLVFSRIAWSAPKKPEQNKNKMFLILNNLIALKFVGKGCITPHERSIINCFYHQIRCPKLSTLSFEESSSEGSTVELQSSEDTSDKKDTFILSKFLLQHEASLRVLEVERRDIDLVADNLDNFKHLRLTKLTCNVASPTADRTLGIQTTLKFLDCFTNAIVPEENLKALMGCIQSCSHTLREISFIQNIVQNKVKEIPATDDDRAESDTTSNSTPDECVFHDCSVYRICRKLKSLTIICVANGSTNGPHHCLGRIVNMHKLPLSLSTLIIRFDMVQDSDMSQFAKRFPRMAHLKYFVFQGNPEYPFCIKLKWIQILIKLPNLLTFEFHNCEVEQGKAVKLFINSIPGLANKLRINSGSCIFRQAQAPK